VVATTFSHPLDRLDQADYIVPDLTGMDARLTGDRIELRFLPLER
jgi:hypothetical protein